MNVGNFPKRPIYYNINVRIKPYVGGKFQQDLFIGNYLQFNFTNYTMPHINAFYSRPHGSRINCIDKTPRIIFVNHRVQFRPHHAKTNMLIITTIWTDTRAYYYAHD